LILSHPEQKVSDLYDSQRQARVTGYGIAGREVVQLRLVVEHFDADLDAAWVTLLNATLQGQEHVFAARCIEFAMSLQVRGRRAGERALEGFVNRLERDAIVSRKRQGDLFVAFADAAELSALHQASLGDPARVPTFSPFGNENYFFESNACAIDPNPPFLFSGPGFAWNHGDIQKPVATVWLGLVGPGMQHQGRNDWLWLDHTDVRPTMLTLLGLKDDYLHDGRVLAEVLLHSSVPPTLAPAVREFDALAEVYKQINAPFGRFGNTTLVGLATSGRLRLSHKSSRLGDASTARSITQESAAADCCWTGLTKRLG
jgi:hypothetical protein